uniref:Archaemetzincin-2 n=1 Tax=Ailuropoda melanoleuca TaxID=9646 RepID=A0A7N5KLH5_AILME
MGRGVEPARGGGERGTAQGATWGRAGAAAGGGRCPGLAGVEGAPHSTLLTRPRHARPCKAKTSMGVYLPKGSLGNTRIISEEYIKWLKGYCEAFFYGLTVKLLEPVPVSVTRCSFRINDNTHNLQIHAGHILRFLKKKKPRDAFCIVGVTMIDLYPRDSWNFVFGQASLTDGVGIFSFARYGSDFYSSRYEGRVNKPQRVSSSDYSIFDNYYIPEVTSVLLLRSCKTLTHEIGHIFGLRHCQWLACLMQGSNHLEEADRRPLNLCPICLRKLQCAVGFSIIERYQALVRWIDDETVHTPGVSTEHSREHDVNLPKPVEAFKEWKEWIIKCLAVVQK